MFNKTIDGFDEIYQVGKLQLWSWCSWSCHGYDYARSLGNEPLYCSAESLAKGRYVILEGTVEFGRIWSRAWVVRSFTSLKKAIAHVKSLQEYDDYKFGHEHSLSGNVTSHFYEIWQICDDHELWAWWEDLSNENLQYVNEDCDVCCCDASRHSAKVVKVSENPTRMFTKENCGVDVFEVGKNQLVELLGSHADIDESADFWLRRGFGRPVAALMMARHYEDGSYGEPALLSWVTCEKSVRQILANEYDRDAWYGDCYVYEVWYVVDDDKPTRHIAKPNRYYYAAVHDHGVNFCNDVHYLVRFPDIQARDKFVDDEEWDGRSYKIESITRDVARGICPGAFGDNAEVLPPFTGRDAADVDTALDVMAGDGTYYWCTCWDGSQVLNCYHR